MRIHQFLAKEVLKSCGVSVPQGAVAKTSDAAEAVAAASRGSA